TNIISDLIRNAANIYIGNKPERSIIMEEVYLAGGCLWGVLAFIKTLPGVQSTEAGIANGTKNFLEGNYDGYAECVKTEYDQTVVTIKDLMGFLLEVIDPYSLNKQGQDVVKKYRTGLYSEN